MPRRGGRAAAYRPHLEPAPAVQPKQCFAVAIEYLSCEQTGRVKRWNEKVGGEGEG